MPLLKYMKLLPTTNKFFGLVILIISMILISNIISNNIQEEISKINEAKSKDLVLKTIDYLQNNSLESTKQITDGIELKLAPKLTKANTKIDWNESGNVIVNKIKGLSPYPSSWCKIQLAEKTLNFKLFDASLSDLKIPGKYL